MAASGAKLLSTIALFCHLVLCHILLIMYASMLDQCKAFIFENAISGLQLLLFWQFMFRFAC